MHQPAILVVQPSHGLKKRARPIRSSISQCRAHWRQAPDTGFLARLVLVVFAVVLAVVFAVALAVDLVGEGLLRAGLFGAVFVFSEFALVAVGLLAAWGLSFSLVAESRVACLASLRSRLLR